MRREKRILRRGLSCLLMLLLAVSLCGPAAAAEEFSADKAAVLDWLRESCGLSEALLARLNITEEQIAALKGVFLEEEEAPEEPQAKLTVYEAALRLLSGEYGTDEECRAQLKAAGLDYWSVRHMANALQNGYDQVAKDVIDGQYGNQAARFRALAQNGYDPLLVQQIVNGMLAG